MADNNTTNTAAELITAAENPAADELRAIVRQILQEEVGQAGQNE